MSHSFKKFIVLSILMALPAVAFFSFFVMDHNLNESMSPNCIFSVMGASPCPQDAVIMVAHHISSYNSFFNIPINSNASLFTLTIALLAAGFILLKDFFSKNPTLLLFHNARYRQSDPELYLNQPRKITRWLSLFENSPSLI